LAKFYYCHDGSVKKNGKKKTNKKDLVKMVGSKMTCLEWHFGQVGHGGKKTIGGVFFTEIPS
jgi:hypothetical protein